MPAMSDMVPAWPLTADARAASLGGEADAATEAAGHRLAERYFRYTPLLWLAGVLAPAGVFLLAVLAWRRWPRGAVINTVVGLWIAIAVAQAFAASVNAWLVGEGPSGMVRHAASLGVLGWVFAGLAIAVGYAYGLARPRIARSVAMLGLYVLVLGSLALLLSQGGPSSLIFRAPVGLLLPNSPTIQFYFSIALYATENTFGEIATRLILFFPWPTALAMGSIAIAAISLRDRSWAWRCLGFAGGTMGVVFSWSRIGLAAFAIVVAAEAFCWLGRLSRCLLLAVLAFGLLGLLVAGFDPLEHLAQTRHAVDAARSGSSEARTLIYQKSWEGFLKSPLVGYGWIGPSVHPTEYLPIGSHSTLYGLSYTGGVLTVGAFLLALAATLLACARVAIGPDRSGAGRTALLLVLTLFVFSPYEMLFSFSLPCLFLFTWIGGALREAAPATGSTIPAHLCPRHRRPEHP